MRKPKGKEDEKKYPMDLDSRDYAFAELGKEDRRMIRCRKEAVFVWLLILAVSVCAMLAGYALSPTAADLEAGASVPVLFGYPVWVIVPTAVYIAEFLVLLVFGIRVMDRPSLAARIGEEEDTGRKDGV